MSRTIISIFIFISAYVTLFGQDTTIFNQDITLNSDWSSYDNVEILAGNTITLSSGFYYASGGSGVFTADADIYSVNGPGGFSPYYQPGDSTQEGSTLDYSLPVGSIAGSAGVNSSGAATYTIPIQVPKGNNGMEPHLSIIYNSQGGKGILGKGWNFVGLSSIIVTGKNYYHDGSKGNISATDTSCRVNWDGQRLFGIDSIGLAADTFQTEIFSNTVITKRSGSNEDYFEVKIPGGRTMIYGKSESSQMHLDEDVEWMWLLEKVYDRDGNTITYSYNSDNDKHRILLSKIEYGGDSISPVNEISFHYTAKSNIDYASIMNYLIIDDQKLDSISITSNNTYIGSYAFRYQESVNELLLDEIIQYDIDNYRYNSTKLDWEIPSANLSATPTSVGILSGTYFQHFSGDYNGDGYSDIMAVELDDSQVRYKYYLYPGSSSGLQTLSDSGSLPRSYTEEFWPVLAEAYDDSLCGQNPAATSYDVDDVEYVISGDFDGDGLDELMVKVWEWYLVAETLPADLNSGFEFDYLYYDNFNGLDVCYDHYVLEGENCNIANAQYLGRFINFDKSQYSQDRVITARLGERFGFTSQDAWYPDFVGLGYSMIPDDQKVKYYDISNDTVYTVCDNNGGDYWGDFNGDGMHDYIIQEHSSKFSIEIYNQTNETFDFVKADSKKVLGTIDLNGDGEYAYLSIDIPTKTYEDLWNEWTEGYWLVTEDSIWNDFLTNHYKNGEELYDFYYPSYVPLFCNYNDNESCRQGFLESDSITIYNTNELAIEHLNPNISKVILDTLYEDTYVGYYSIASDINADGANELLIFNGNTLKKIYYNFIPTYSNGEISYSFSVSSPNLYMPGRALIGDFDGNGILEFVTISNRKHLSFYNGTLPGYYISDITDGFGRKSSFYYDALTNSNLYTKGSDGTYPVADLAGPLYVVSDFSSDNGVADSDSIHYIYEDAKIHLQGKGFLGFMKSTSRNITQGSSAITYKSFDTLYYQSYLVKNQQKIGSTLVKEHLNYSDIESADDNNAFIYNIKTDSTKQTDHLNNVTATSLFQYNDNNQLIQKTKQISNLATISESYTYTHGGWDFPYLLRSKCKKFERSDSDSTVVDSTLFEYGNDGHLLYKKELCGTDKELITRFKNYDSFGNPIEIAIVGNRGANLTLDSIRTLYSYSDCGRYITSKRDTLNNVINYYYNLATGTINSTTTVNDLETSYDYGPFNSVETETTPTLIQKAIKLYWAANHPDAPSDAHFYKWSKSSGTPENLMFYDAAGRELRAVSTGFDDSKLYVDTEYDSKGRKWKVSMPYISTNSPIYTTITYDNLGRISVELSPDNTQTEYDYSALWKKVTVSKGGISQASEQTFNSLGEVIQSKDNLNNIVYNSYYPDGNLYQSYTSVNSSFKTTFKYDHQGNRIEISDPDAGIITSMYDDFGYLVNQIDARYDTTIFEYDPLGRTIQSSDSRGDIYYTFISDTTNAAFGQVDSIYNADGSLSESFTYDSNYGRLLSSTRKISEKTFTNEYTYDWYGRPWTRTYPSGFEIKNFYTDNGDLEKITGAGATIWQCNDVNEIGQIASYSQGNYSTAVDYDAYGMLEEITTGSVFNMEFGFDDIGNLSFREDVLTNQKEEFSYDNLNRLTGIDYYLNSNHVSAGDLDLTYDNGGNITSKSELASTINYGETGHGYAGPHALTSIEEPISSYKPPPQVIDYTCFNKVSTIQDTIGQDTTLSLAFTYGLNNQRVKTILSRNTTVERIKYFDGDYEEDSTSTGTNKYHYINAPTGLIGIFVSEGSADTLYHVLTDHLGSLNGVINAETDDVTYYSFNAWGIPRDPDDWTSPFDGELFARRGYTGHEHLLEFSLINMNGRIYDPVLGRFLSPDPYVQLPGYANGFNRYSYCLNNPLIYTDPDGELAWFVPIIIGAVIYGSGNLAIHASRGEVNSFGDGLKYFATGAVAGAFVGATWSLGLASIGTGSLINGMGFMASTAGKIAGTTILAGKGINALSYTASLFGNNENADKILFGKMYFDENGAHGLSQALTRYTWEGLQTWIGYNFTQFRNAFGGVDRVDYLGGATFATNENSGHHMAVSIGHNLNFYIPGTINGDFTNYVTKGNPMYMHEYGHTFDSQTYGLSYLFAIGLPSLISANNARHAPGYPAHISTHDLRVYEMRANRHAARYFGEYYGVNWSTDPYPRYPSKTIEDYYPLHR